MAARAGIVTTQNLLPTTEDLANLGMLDGWIRILVVDVDRFDSDLEALQWPSTLNVCALLEGQTIGVGNDFAGWVPTIQGFAQRFKGRVQAVECANELRSGTGSRLAGIPIDQIRGSSGGSRDSRLRSRPVWYGMPRRTCGRLA